MLLVAGYDSCIMAGLETALEGYDDPGQTLMESGLACVLPKLPAWLRSASTRRRLGLGLVSGV
jgi:hypothetical protein